MVADNEALVKSLTLAPFTAARWLSWPKIPSVALDGYHERESEYQRSLLVQRSAREVARTSRFRQFDANFEVNLSIFSTSNQPGQR
jgi:hypothetical protein